MTVRSFTTTKISLEDIFIRVYGDENVPAAAGPSSAPHWPPPGTGVVPWRSTILITEGRFLSFEFIRTMTKRRFWIGTLSVPLILAVVSGCSS